ncbi:MAG: SDR family NAD(P)-dependent oxidoreductase, partial [Limnohabitans sp.]|nr:SDR family NAD(P)-dependent oxidoreductase [Limnohabitans sp.]
MSPSPASTYQSVFTPGLLAGQVIVVTGGGSGIGRCTAHELASLGAHVVLVGRNPDKLTATAQEIVGDGGQASWHSCDIRREEDVKSMIAQVVQQHGRIHGLVNNAGGQYISPLAKTSAKGWQAVIDTNLTGGFLVARECFN